MDKVELYRDVFSSFKRLCAQGKQPGSFGSYCREHGVVQSYMRHILKDEFQNVKTLAGFKLSRGKSRRGIGKICSRVYEEFKRLCAEGRQPGTLKAYCLEKGITYSQMHSYLYYNNLRVAGLPGYRASTGGGRPGHSCQEVPFEDVIFEEAGFLPAGGGNVITVMVDGHITVSFPSETDIDVVARFIRKIGKEVCHVGA